MERLEIAFPRPLNEPLNTVDIGGMDESWDAPDYQNMFLAMVPPRAAENFMAGVAANYLPILPSFHRPELVNYWLSNATSDLIPTSPPFLAYLDPSPPGLLQNYSPALRQARR